MNRFATNLIVYIAREQERLFLWSPVCVGLGIALYFALPVEPLWWAAVPVLIASLAAAWLGRRQLPNLGVVPLLFVAGFMAAQLQTARMAAPMLTRDTGFTEFSGHVALIEPLPTGRRVTVEALTIPLLTDGKRPASIRLLDRKADVSLVVGDRISGKAFLRAISEPVLPGDYDFRRHAFFDSLGATGFLAGPLKVTQPAEHGLSFANFFDRARASLQAQISQTLQGDAAAISDALLTGEQQGISEETLTAMRLSGLTHILSVSGLHIGLAAGLLFFLVRALLALSPRLALHYPIKKYAAVAALLGATGYTMFAGAPVPAVRSLLMTGIALLAIMVDRSALSLRTVALSAVLILLFVPNALMGPSFQLSYAAIAAIIAAYEASEGWRERRERPKNIVVRGLLYVGAIAITSLIASLATAPLTHYHFQQLSFYGVIANMLAVPLTSFWLMPAALLALFLLPFGLAHWPLVLLGRGVDLLMTIAVRTAALPGADWAPANLPLPGMLAIIFGGLWVLIWQQRWRWVGLASIAIGLMMALFPAQPNLLLSGDGKYAALKSDSGYVLVSDTGRRKADSFVPDQWRRWLGIRAFEDGSAYCDALSCKVGTTTIVRDSTILPEICNHTSDWLVYSTGRLSRCGNRVIDEPNLWRNGALALYPNGTIDTVQAHVGYRPWSIRQHYSKKP